MAMCIYHIHSIFSLYFLFILAIKFSASCQVAEEEKVIKVKGLSGKLAHKVESEVKKVGGVVEVKADSKVGTLLSFLFSFKDRNSLIIFTSATCTE